MPLLNSHSPYTDIKIIDHAPTSQEILLVRNKIISDITTNGHKNEQFMIEWFSEPKWTKNNFTYCQEIRDSLGHTIALSSNKILENNSMKILCHYYVMKDQRAKYRSMQHSDLIPDCYLYAKNLGLDNIWYSIHAFDTRHKRYAESNIRKLNGGKLTDKEQPYWSKIRYNGEIEYNYVKQHQFIIDIEKS
jgi:hypothetical protein